MDANELEFPFYTMEGNVYVKHISKSKCICVVSNNGFESITTENYIDLYTNEYDHFRNNTSQIIPKDYFDTERQEIIKHLINA